VATRLWIAKLGGERQLADSIRTGATEALPLGDEDRLLVFPKMSTVVPVHRPEVYEGLPAPCLVEPLLQLFLALLPPLHFVQRLLLRFVRHLVGDRSCKRPLTGDERFDVHLTALKL